MTARLVSRIFLAAILAGALAGAFLTGIQQFAVVPMILEAETYETAAPAGHDHASATHDEDAWAPEDGLERTAYTLLANVLAAVGFGLLLTAGYALRGGVDWRRGILWGLGGFAAFNLAPGLGLPPELPGAAAAGLAERQLWWIATVVLTGSGLATIAFAKRLPFKALGAVLIVLPHVIGAPQPDAHAGLAPADLEQAFVQATFLTNGIFWVVLGAASALLFNLRPGQGINTGAAA